MTSVLYCNMVNSAVCTVILYVNLLHFDLFVSRVVADIQCIRDAAGERRLEYMHAWALILVNNLPFLFFFHRTSAHTVTRMITERRTVATVVGTSAARRMTFTGTSSNISNTK